MTPFERLLQFLFNSWQLDLVIIGKLAIWLVLMLYVIFSLVVVKQVKLMSKAINGLMSRPLMFMAWFLVVLAAGAFIFSLAIL